MYLSFYHLKHKPFQISTDPKFLWLGEKHEEALATLRYGVLDNKGFLLLTGDVGTGKTTLINALLRTIDEDTYVAFIRDPALDPLDFFQYTAYAFGMKADKINSKGSFLIQFEEFLLEAYEKRRKVLLIIDEAQRMSQELLEEVRLLSNIEREESKLLNIFFVGQNEFNDILHYPENRAIRQRITISYNIEELSEEETRQYIKHRLEVASSKEDIGFFSPVQRQENGEYVRQGLRLPLPEVREEIFTTEAISEVYCFSKGYPRLINIICDRALLTGFVEEAKAISLKHVKECVKELEIPHDKEKVARASRSESSLRNSLEELNREFAKLRKAEPVEEAEKNSPRELIKRLEENNEVDGEVNKTHSAPATSEFTITVLPEHEDSVDEKTGSTSIADYMSRAHDGEADVDIPLDENETYDEVNGDDGESFVHQQTVPIDTAIEHPRDELEANEEEQTTQLPPDQMIEEFDESAGQERPKRYLLAAVLVAAVALVYFLFTSPSEEDTAVTETLPPVSVEQAASPPDTPEASRQQENSGISAKTDTTKPAAAIERPAPEAKEIAIKAAGASIEKKAEVSQTTKEPDSAAANTTALSQESKSPPDQITNKIKQLKNLITFEKLIIAFPDNSNLPPVNTLDKLNNLVDSLLTHSSFNVTITYFSANKNRQEENQRSEFQANAVKSYLMGRGLEGSRITLKNSIGQATLPAELNDSEKSTTKRWVEIDVDR